jgi:hypothetical protein
MQRTRRTNPGAMKLLRILLKPLIIFLALAAPRLHASTPLEFAYHVKNDVVSVTFQDRSNFLFVSSDGSQTIVKDGAIYVVVKQSGRPDSVILVTDRRIENTSRASAPQVSKPLPLRHPDRVLLTAYKKQTVPQLYRTSLTYAQQPMPTEAISAKDVTFAEAQHAMHETLMAMDMNMCGATVRALVSAWPPELTRVGHAILRMSGDIEIASLPALTATTKEVSLPRDQPILDYRLPKPPAPYATNATKR